VGLLEVHDHQALCIPHLSFILNCYKDSSLSTNPKDKSISYAPQKYVAAPFTSLPAPEVTLGLRAHTFAFRNCPTEQQAKK
jgi:hypothetical protein